MQGNACFAAIARVRACSFSTSGLLSHRNWCGRQNRQQRRPLDRCLRSCLHASVGRGRSCLSWRHSNRACSAATTYAMLCYAAVLCYCAMLLCYAAAVLSCYSAACFPPYACLNVLATPTHVLAFSPFMLVLLAGIPSKK